MNEQRLYIKKADNAKLEKAFTKVAYHIQQARKHLDAASTQALADEIEITKQGLQRRIDTYKKEVTENAGQ